MANTHPPQHQYPGMPVDLRPEGEILSAAKTMPLVKEEAFEAIRLVIRKDHELPTHQTEGAITVYCLAGRIAFTARGQTHDMKEGHWLFLVGKEPHSLRAIEDSAVLLTILLPRSRDDRQAEGVVPATGP